MRLFRLYSKERLFLQGIMDSAIANTQTKDMNKCCECTCRVLHSLSKSNVKLRAVVMKKIETTGCERYELKIDYVAMDQVCTRSHYQVDILLYEQCIYIMCIVTR